MNAIIKKSILLFQNDKREPRATQAVGVHQSEPSARRNDGMYVFFVLVVGRPSSRDCVPSLEFLFFARASNLPFVTTRKCLSSPGLIRPQDDEGKHNENMPGTNPSGLVAVHLFPSPLISASFSRHENQCDPLCPARPALPYAISTAPIHNLSACTCD